ncbi:MAG: exosortase C-terminal domain/associated protein EpsI [Candidatus Binataceae bacterium]
MDPLDGTVKQTLDLASAQQSLRSIPAQKRWMIVGPVLSVALAFGLYLPILRDWIADLETDPSYSFALLLPFVAGYLAYRRLREDRVAARSLIRLDAAGIFVVLAGCALLVVGDLTTIVFLSRFSFLVVIAGLMITFLGRDTMRRLVFPYGILFFGLPLPSLIYLPLTFKLQLLSSVLATHLLHLAGVFVLREGNILVLKNVSLEVVEACAGLHSVFALVALACIVGYLFLRGPIRRVLLVASAIPIAIGLNAARITSAAIAANTWGPGAAEGFTHTSMGVAIFALGTLIVLFISARLASPAREADAQVPVSNSVRPLSSGRAALSVLAVIVILLITFAMHREGVRTVEAVPLREPLAAFPMDLDNWRGTDVALTENQFDSLGTRDVLMREYSNDSQSAPVLLHVAFYPVQQQGSTMHSPLHCIPGSGWEVEQRTLTPIVLDNAGRPFDANEVVFRRENDRILVLYWYLEQGAPQASEFGGAFRTMWDSATEGRSYGCLIRFSTPITTTTQDALSRTSALVAAALPILDQRFLPAPDASKPAAF